MTGGVTNAKTESKYAQVRDILRGEILEGAWPAGAKLPSERDLMDRFQVSQATIGSAMRELAQAGFVRRKRRLGTIVASAEERRAQAPRKTLYLVGGGSMDPAANPLNAHLPRQMYKGAINNTRHDVVLLDYAEWPSVDEALPACDGVVFINGLSDDASDALGTTPSISINRRSVQFMPVNAVNCDEIVVAFTAVSYLVRDLGHAEVAAVWGGGAYHQDKLAGYRMALDMARLPFRSDRVIESLGGEEAGRAAAERLLPLLPEVTAVYVDTDLKAVGLVKALRERGVHVPEDISVIGTDDVRPLSERFGLTTMRVPFYEMGREAVRLLDLRLADAGRDVNSVVLTGELVRRATCRRRAETGRTIFRKEDER